MQDVLTVLSTSVPIVRLRWLPLLLLLLYLLLPFLHLLLPFLLLLQLQL